MSRRNIRPTERIRRGLTRSVAACPDSVPDESVEIPSYEKWSDGELNWTKLTRMSTVDPQNAPDFAALSSQLSERPGEA